MVFVNPTLSCPGAFSSVMTIMLFMVNTAERDCIWLWCFHLTMIKSQKEKKTKEHTKRSTWMQKLVIFSLWSEFVFCLQYFLFFLSLIKTKWVNPLLSCLTTSFGHICCHCLRRKPKTATAQTLHRTLLFSCTVQSFLYFAFFNFQIMYPNFKAILTR